MARTLQVSNSLALGVRTTTRPVDVEQAGRGPLAAVLERNAHASPPSTTPGAESSLPRRGAARKK